MTPTLSLSLGICSEVYVHGFRSVHEQAITDPAAALSLFYSGLQNDLIVRFV